MVKKVVFRDQISGLFKELSYTHQGFINNCYGRVVVIFQSFLSDEIFILFNLSWFHNYTLCVRQERAAL